MYRKTQDSEAHRERIASHATKGSARGYVAVPDQILADADLPPPGKNSRRLADLRAQKENLLEIWYQARDAVAAATSAEEKTAQWRRKNWIEGRLAAVKAEIKELNVLVSATYNFRVYETAAQETLAPEDYNRFMTRVLEIRTTHENAPVEFRQYLKIRDRQQVEQGES